MVEMQLSNWKSNKRDYEKVIHPYNSESVAYMSFFCFVFKDNIFELQVEDSCMFTDFMC